MKITNVELSAWELNLIHRSLVEQMNKIYYTTQRTKNKETLKHQTKTWKELDKVLKAVKKAIHTQYEKEYNFIKK